MMIIVSSKQNPFDSSKKTPFLIEWCFVLANFCSNIEVKSISKRRYCSGLR